MGVLRSTETMAAEVEELRHDLLRGIVGRPPPAEKSNVGVRRPYVGVQDGRIVCVTGGISFVGFAVVNRLLDRGYTVRLALQTQEDLDKLREMDVFGELGRDGVRAVMANVMDIDSLCDAFDGCTGVFHTSSLIDPSGISGYSKHMANIEVLAAEKVIEACVRTQSVSKCIFTSSLLACVWRDNSNQMQRHPTIIDENCWSDETLCREKKLWFALGKTMAEKAAWRAARGRNLKLVTICPGLVTGPGFRRRNSTWSIAYLKGAQELFAEGLLATADIEKVAEAHVSVYEAMGSTACGRYICYDHVVRRVEEVSELQRQLGIANGVSLETATDQPTWFQLSNGKLSRLLSSISRCSNSYIQ